MVLLALLSFVALFAHPLAWQPRCKLTAVRNPKWPPDPLCQPVDRCPIGWNDLLVTYSPNPNSPNAFHRLPRDLTRNVDFQPAGGCGAQAYEPFIGRAFADDHDAFRLLFDSQGFIAGVQLAVPTGIMTAELMANPTFVMGANAYYATVYFVYPNTQLPFGAKQTGFNGPNGASNLCSNNRFGYCQSLSGSLPCWAMYGVDVCKTGRYPTEFSNDGTGRGMWQQLDKHPNASDPGSLFETYQNGSLPMFARDASMMLDAHQYSEGGCVRGIGMSMTLQYDVDIEGVTYFTTTHQSETRDATFANLNLVLPIFNAGRLNAFAFITNIEASKLSKRAEKMTIGALEQMFGTRTIPSQFYTEADISMIHVYMTEQPYSTATC